MKGNISAVFVLGDTSDLHKKLNTTEWEEVIVTLPKFEIATSLDSGELVDYIKTVSSGIAFTDDADFSIMCPDIPWLISDIIQKSKIKVDEDGLEAAAVTAMTMATNAAMPEPAKPKEFTADHPFSFYVFSNSGEKRELLFFGQYVE